MFKTRKKIFINLVVLVLVSAMCCSFPVSAAVSTPVQPYASNYLTSYSTYICAMGGGEIQIWFEVMGTGTMDELGVLSIMLYESSDNTNWEYVDTFLHEDYESMLAEDDYFYCSYVPYDGTARKYYKAYVCIWAGKNGNGDTRYMWATSVRAT